jgi:hypothetical protein
MAGHTPSLGVGHPLGSKWTVASELGSKRTHRSSQADSVGLWIDVAAITFVVKFVLSRDGRAVVLPDSSHRQSASYFEMSPGTACSPS